MKSFNLAVAMAVGLAGRVCAQPHPYQAEISRLAQAGDVSTATVKARAERVDALVSAMAPKFPVVHPVLKEETSDLPAPAVHGEPASLAGFYLSPATMKDPRLAELKAVLADWNHRLQLKSLPQIYAALALFKAIYALPGDIRAVDPDTAKLLDARRQDMVRYQGLFARLAHPYLLALYNAAQHIGDRYNLYHPNNIDTFNCGTFTKTMSEAPTWLNTADGQYDQARADAAGLSFSRDPRPGDLIFFQNTYSYILRPGERPPNDGVTHVEFYVGGGTRPGQRAVLLGAAGRRSGVTLHLVLLRPKGTRFGVAGYARPGALASY